MSAPIWADSDGYYCVGPDYLAYQFGMAPLPIAPHRVYIIRLTGEHAMTEPATVELPQFQVHGMRCDETTIRVAAFDALYTVRLDRSRRPVRYEVDRSKNPQNDAIRSLSNQRQLGGFGFHTKGLAVQRTLLMEAPSGHEFVIEIAPKLSGPTRCDTEVTTRLLELDASHRIISQRLLFKGRGLIEDCAISRHDNYSSSRNRTTSSRRDARRGRSLRWLN